MLSVGCAGQRLQHSVPVFMYGAAHPRQRSLDDVRRALGYFKGAREGEASISLLSPLPCRAAPCKAQSIIACKICLMPVRRPQACGSTSAGRWVARQGVQAVCTPDHGSPDVDPCHGVAAIGASGWVTNLNVPLATSDLAAARSIARSVSARGGGLAAVEAMALPHTGGAHKASNL